MTVICPHLEFINFKLLYNKFYNKVNFLSLIMQSNFKIVGKERKKIIYNPISVLLTSLVLFLPTGVIPIFLILGRK